MNLKTAEKIIDELTKDKKNFALKNLQLMKQFLFIMEQ